MLKQKTLAEPVEFAGVGVHSGALCRVRVEPAEIDHGLVFQVGGVRIPAHVDSVVR
jgi:UDP-3-O-acyl-N-acetylglucosamine deacetylase